MTLDQIPIRNIVLIMEDESNVKLLGQATIADNKKLWSKIQKDYQERNPSHELKRLIAEHKKLLSETIEYNKNVSLLQFLVDFDGEEQPFFEAAKIPFDKDPVKRTETLKKQISKSSQLIEIYQAKLDKLEKEIAEQKESETTKPLTIKKLNKALATMEMNGASIPDYNTFTYGQYEAWNEVLIEKQKNNAS